MLCMAGPFEISARFHVPQTPRNSFALFTVKLDKHPIFFKRSSQLSGQYIGH
ncbi:hypothetical protein EDB85DRAFT_1990186 [Lactarius pseudohatsudake]|nr:hypothetical protein EDB85DRAFT_1990186 [Lactarius pseudohatsudake]